MMGNWDPKRGHPMHCHHEKPFEVVCMADMCTAILKRCVCPLGLGISLLLKTVTCAIPISFTIVKRCFSPFEVIC
eukprot:scaffold111836_cov22-Tisochrysis_lutea.AAC.1